VEVADAVLQVAAGDLDSVGVGDGALRARPGGQGEDHVCGAVAAPAVVGGAKYCRDHLLVLALAHGTSKGQLKPRSAHFVRPNEHFEVVELQEPLRHIGAKVDSCPAGRVLVPLGRHRVAPQGVTQHLLQELVHVVSGNAFQRLPVCGKVLESEVRPLDGVQLREGNVSGVEQAAVQDEDALVDEAEERQVLKQLAEHAEGVVVVLVAALLLKSVYAADGKVLVIAPVERHRLRKGKQQRH